MAATTKCWNVFELHNQIYWTTMWANIIQSAHIYQPACKSQKTSFQRSNLTPEFNLSKEGELTESVWGVLAGLSLPFTIHFNTIKLIRFFRWKSCSERLWTKVQMPRNHMKGCKKCIKPSMVLTPEGQGWGHGSNAWYWHVISVLCTS